MSKNQLEIDGYEIAKICLGLCLVIALKVWDSTKNVQLALLAFIFSTLLYLIVKAIRSYYRRKTLLESGIDLIDAMSGEEFEELLLSYYINLGYIGKTTPKTGDYGADLVLERSRPSSRCKFEGLLRWPSVRRLGVESSSAWHRSLGPVTAKLCNMAKVQKRLSDQRVQLLRRGRGRGPFDSSPFGQRCGQRQNPAVFLDRSRSLLTEDAFCKQLPRLTQRP